MDEVPEINVAGKKSSKLLGPHVTGARRRSSIFDGIPMKLGPVGSSIMSFACRPSHFGLNDESGPKQQKVEYENTYRMEPPKTFMAGPAERIIREVLEHHLSKSSVYECLHISQLTKQMAQEIKDRVKRLNVQRYKIVAAVTMGQKHEQGVRCGSRCVWDDKRDTWASASYENAHLFAIGEVYALCYE